MAAAAIVVVLVAALLGGALALVPRLVDSAAVRRVIERELSARVGGKLRYDSLALRLVPLPRAEIRGVSVYSPETLTGHAAVVHVELSLVALLRGAVRPTAIRVKEPVLEVPLGLGGGGTGEPFTAYRDALGRVVETLAREAPGMSVQILDGRLDLVRDGRPVVALSKLTAEVDVAADAIDDARARRRRSVAGGRGPPARRAGLARGLRHARGEGLADGAPARGSGGGRRARPAPGRGRRAPRGSGGRQGAMRATLDASSPELVWSAARGSSPSAPRASPPRWPATRIR